MILMKDDACLTGLHPVSASGELWGGGSSGPQSFLPTGFLSPPGTSEYSQCSHAQ